LLADLEKASLEIVSEQRLLERLDADLPRIQDAYEENPDLLNEEEVERMESLENLGTALNEFLEVQEDMEVILNWDDYEDAVTRLAALDQTLAGKAVQKRVARERRQLQAQLPRIRQAEATRVKREIEKAAPKCSKGHTMTLRQAEEGWFWGCTQFPKCRLTEELNEEQETALRLSQP